MKPSLEILVHKVLRLARVALPGVALLFGGCGGGVADITASVGSGGSGIVSGTVTGFASVIVDGTEYDDNDAPRQMQDAAGSLHNAALKLGQRVTLRYSGANVAQSIEIQPQLIGPVSATPAADGTFAVMGQYARIVAGANDPSASAPTVLDGYAGAAAIAAGDDVEVHGSWVFDSALGADVLVATRVEKRQLATNPVQLGGVVTAIAGNSLRINAAAGTEITAASLPSGLAVGNVVRVWVTRSALATAPVAATRVVNASIDAAELPAGGGSIGGMISAYDPATHSFSIDGVKVALADTAGIDTAALAQGGYAVVRLGSSGAMGMRATSVQMRRGMNARDLGKTNTLSAVTRNIDWSASSVSFMLRGTRVQAGAAAISNSCRAINPGRDFVVTVRGAMMQAGDTVTATQVSCSQNVAAGMSADYTGTITMLNTAAKTMTIAADGATGNVTAAWDANTYFDQDAATLGAGMHVGLEGVIDAVGDVLRLTRVQAMP